MSNKVKRDQCPYCQDTCFVLYDIQRGGEKFSIEYTLKSHVFHWKVIGCSDCLMIRSNKLPKDIIDHLIIEGTTKLGNKREIKVNE